MYKQRPAYPALIAAAVVFVFGAAVTWVLRNRALDGDMDIQPALFAGMVTVALSGALFISAFARYVYTHLWKSTGARHSDKYKKVENRLRKSKARASRG